MDLPTLFIAQTCMLAATAAMLWVSRSEVDHANGMRMWRLAITSQAVAYLLLSAPGAWVPSVVTALLGNLAGATSVALAFIAIRQFAGRGFDKRLLAGMIVVVTIAGGLSGERAAWAAIFNGFAYAGYEWFKAITLWRAERPGTARVQRVVALLYMCMGTLLPVRAIVLLAIGQSRLSLDQDNQWQVPIYLFGFIYLVLVNLGFVLMCKMRAEAETRLQARTDDLTGLSNRRALGEDIAQALVDAQQRERPFAILMVDVDRFKFINDTHGHGVGDATLAAFATRLDSTLHGTGRSYRYGGEEFCLLLPDTEVDGARVVAERLRQQIMQPFEGTMRALTASFGVTAWQPGDDKDSLFRRADRALYAAKSGGRNRVESA